MMLTRIDTCIFAAVWTAKQHIHSLSSDGASVAELFDPTGLSHGWYVRNLFWYDND